MGYSNVQFEKSKNKNNKLLLEARFDSKVFARTLDNLTKDVHTIINSSQDSVKCAYLRGFYEAEGYPFGKRIGITNTDKVELDFIRNLLSELGFDRLSKVILSHDKAKYNDGRKDLYALYISSKNSLELFRSKIGFGLHGDRNKRLNAVIGTIKKEFKRFPEMVKGVIEYGMEFGKFDAKTIAKEFNLSLRRSRDIIKIMREKKIAIPINKRPPFLYKVSDSYDKNKIT